MILKNPVPDAKNEHRLISQVFGKAISTDSTNLYFAGFKVGLQGINGQLRVGGSAHKYIQSGIFSLRPGMYRNM